MNFISQNHTVIRTFEFSDYDFSGDDLDLDNMKKWTKKGYELLQ